ncbi:MAG: DUF2721 domain-containing protein [Leptospiraceae bacterium]|jgi:Mn2+/Fe2+ NRAMP family transporter|nr:DUF2721 domain-containing protein [Leptospiraceae bacterium]MCZ8346988.1 DUF2721 domain-containing protein [Leptospiraceae bacterium]
MLEQLFHPGVLGAMITPAVLITACASLILSTANRLGRIFDRVNQLKIEVETILNGKSRFIEERRSMIRKQLIVQKKRARYIQLAMKCLYSATCLFILCSLASALNVFFHGKLLMAPEILAILGVIVLFFASFFLFYETRYNLYFIEGQIEITRFLEEKIP